MKVIEPLLATKGSAEEVGGEVVPLFLLKHSFSVTPSTLHPICRVCPKRVLGGEISVVFCDMTTLYFEASDEDDLRKTGFSKDGKHENPQIYIGLLVGLGGCAIGYDIFAGNIYEGHTLLPFMERIRNKYLSLPIGKSLVTESKSVSYRFPNSILTDRSFVSIRSTHR